MNTDLTDIILSALRGKCSVPDGETLTAALSGGSDSVALLLALREIGRYKIAALHVHHGLRENADGDEDFCRGLCESLGVPLTVKHVTVEKNGSLEAAAREARYAAFEEYLEENEGYLLTAHRLEDQAETFLMNVARGSGIGGLCGIPRKRGRILRPMLDADKKTVLSFLSERSADWREDESNDNEAFTRNFLRRRVLPPLYEREDLRFLTGFSETLETLREERACLDEIASTYRAEQNARAVFSLPRPLRWRVLKERCPTLTREQFEKLCDLFRNGEDQKIQLSGHFMIVKDGRLFFEKDGTDDLPLPRIPLHDTVELEEKNVFIKYFSEIHTPFTKNVADCAKIADGALYLRSRRPGDCITLQGRRVTKTLKKLFSEDKTEHRDRKVIIVDGKDRVVFAEGYGVSLPFAPDESTKEYLEIIIKEKQDENRKRR